MSTQNNPKVTIVVPVYNRERMIGETIDSALRQTYSNIEIIICDNCSTDSTLKIVENYASLNSNIKIVKNEENLGPVLNWKVGFDSATGDYIKILWSDDLIAETFIADAIAIMDDETAFVMSGISTFDSTTKEVLSEFNFNGKESHTIEQYLDDILMFNKNGFPSSPGCALFRALDLRSAFVIDVVNTDNLNFRRYGAGNDLLLFLITAVKYKKIKILPYLGSLYREHKESLSISHASELAIYYEWAKCYFVNNYYPALKNDYKAKLFLKKNISKTFTNVYESAKGNPRIFSCLKIFLKKVVSKSNG